MGNNYGTNNYQRSDDRQATSITITTYKTMGYVTYRRQYNYLYCSTAYRASLATIYIYGNTVRTK